MVGFQEVFEVSKYDNKRLRERIAEARKLERKLASEHSYAKYREHIDHLEVLELTNELGVHEMDEIMRPYLMDRGRDARWKYHMYKQQTERWYWLLKRDVREAKRVRLE